MLAAILVCGATTVMTSCSDDNDDSSKSEILATDYNVKTNWLKFPKITKDVDAFYIYSTAYIESSFEEGAPD